MSPEEQNQTRKQLLDKLFDLMAKTTSITGLPPERVEMIKAKYRMASDENIRSGIAMLEEEIKNEEALEKKKRESFMKKINKLKELKETEAAERARSEKLADKLLENLD
jgi:predicted Holliday junction resolvase-like endonuclease